MPTYLITGGCRSGKSRFALDLAKSAKKPFYIATAAPDDVEMRARIALHQRQRGDHWSTIEEQLNLDAAITQAVSSGADFIVLDCITIWVSNILLSEDADLDTQVANLLSAIKQAEVPLAIVTNEVGSGIVPDNSLARKFRDSAGIANQRIAQAVDHVYTTISGIPLKLK